MSDTAQNRFEIDLDEIERQLRRSAELDPPATGPQADPLAELARIVGQDDPFLGILGDNRRPEPSRERREPVLGGQEAAPAAPAPRSQADAVLTAEDRGVLGTGPLPPQGGDLGGAPEPFDPVVRSYGSESAALDQDDFVPASSSAPRRRVGAVLAVVALAAVGAGGAFTWRKMSGDTASSGPPPLIKADNAPLKVQPENPGGMDIPNQNRQIYEGPTDNARSRVLDRQEQPIDVREAARHMPQPEPVPEVAPPMPAQAGIGVGVVPQTPDATLSQPAPNVAVAPPVAAPGTPDAVPPSNGQAPNVVAAPAAPGRNAALSALGEPRRVRTVAIRPDGTPIGGGLMVTNPDAQILPSNQVPPPVTVPTISIPMNPAPAQPAPPAASSATPSADDGTAPSTATPIQVLPPARPIELAARTAGAPAEEGNQALAGATAPAEATGADGADTAPAAPTGPVVSVRPPARPARLAQQAAATTEGADQETAAISPAGRTYAVQIAVRPTEAAARTAYEQLADKYPTELGGKPATVTEGNVNGRTVYRIRVTPLSREDANTLCTRLKSSGGQCFVVAN